MRLVRSCWFAAPGSQRLGSPRVGRRAADRSEVPTSPLPQFLSRNTSQPALIQRPLLDNSLRSRSVCQQPTAFLALATDWRPTRHPIRLDPRTNLRNRTPEARRPHSPNGSPHDDNLGGGSRGGTACREESFRESPIGRASCCGRNVLCGTTGLHHSQREFTRPKVTSRLRRPNSHAALGEGERSAHMPAAPTRWVPTPSTRVYADHLSKI